MTELKVLNSSLTTEEMVSEIQELKAECSGYRARLEKIKSASNHITPEEKDKVRNPPGICPMASLIYKCCEKVFPPYRLFFFSIFVIVTRFSKILIMELGYVIAPICQ